MYTSLCGSAVQASKSAAVVVLFGAVLATASCSREGDPLIPELSMNDSGGFIENSTGNFTAVRNVYGFIRMQNRGGIVENCIVKPAFPIHEGLSTSTLNFRKYGNSCALEGFIPVVQEETTYALTASNSSGESLEPIMIQLASQEALAQFTHVNGDREIALGNSLLDVSRGRKFEVSVTNSGFGAAESQPATDSCVVTTSFTDANVDAALMAAVTDVTGEVAENGRDCVIKGTITSEILPVSGLMFTVATTTTATDESLALFAQIGFPASLLDGKDTSDVGAAAGTSSLTFPVRVSIPPPLCTEAELANAPADADFPISGIDLMYFRGNHSNWEPLEEYRFINKEPDDDGNPRIQVIADIRAREGDAYPDAAAARQTQFKIASNDSTWAIQLWVHEDDKPATIRSGPESLLPEKTNLPLSRGGGGLLNNHVSFSLGSSYSIVATFTDTTGVAGAKGTLFYEECTKPQVETATVAAGE